MILFIIFIINIIIIVYQIIAGMMHSNLKSTGYYLRYLGLISISYSVEKDKSTFYVKFLSNYAQLLMILTNLGYESVVDFSGLVGTLGDPVGTSTYSMDCFLKNFAEESTLNILFIKYIVQILMPLVYVILAIIILIILD